MKRWKELSAYTTDGQLQIDNDKIENELRPIALWRKTYLYADLMNLNASIYSLIGTCKSNGLNPLNG